MKTQIFTVLMALLFTSCGQNLGKEKKSSNSSDSSQVSENVQETQIEESEAPKPQKIKTSPPKTAVYYDRKLVAIYSNGVIQPEPAWYLQEDNPVGVQISNDYEFCSPINPNSCGIAYEKDGVVCIKVTKNDRAGEEGGKGGMAAGKEIRFAKASGNKIMAVDNSVYAESEFKETLFTYEGDPTMACIITFFYKHLIF